VVVVVVVVVAVVAVVVAVMMAVVVVVVVVVVMAVLMVVVEERLITSGASFARGAPRSICTEVVVAVAVRRFGLLERVPSGVLGNWSDVLGMGSSCVGKAGTGRRCKMPFTAGCNCSGRGSMPQPCLHKEKRVCDGTGPKGWRAESREQRVESREQRVESKLYCISP
jgi:hypothetical protein